MHTTMKLVCYKCITDVLLNSWKTTAKAAASLLANDFVIPANVCDQTVSAKSVDSFIFLIASLNSYC